MIVPSDEGLQSRQIDIFVVAARRQITAFVQTSTAEGGGAGVKEHSRSSRGRCAQGRLFTQQQHVFAINLKAYLRETRGGFLLVVNDKTDELRRVIVVVV